MKFDFGILDQQTFQTYQIYTIKFKTLKPNLLGDGYVLYTEERCYHVSFKKWQT